MPSSGCLRMAGAGSECSMAGDWSSTADDPEHARRGSAGRVSVRVSLILSWGLGDAKFNGSASPSV
ncbi:MAG: hypothetical protein ACJAYU_004254 [Bradymonadia bacterium]|jgi:hypothetical protein